ncbi:unnamed protein product [Rotaria sordida]|uniref:Uncharacterized protein n=1 Tax=Rotaria sordida TaxID=392033 RepID=A0A813UMC9_9BILA|nr:unnamed protein product [Rotaria sordida]CAF1458934.1 unnamed protein product [Rotaria sordida]CAF3854875.1 unnamed protein product [Rotaria sordida]CAF4023161.1 unnamed protein product [Rotaria sordida]
MASSSRLYRIHRKHLSNNHQFEIGNDTDEIVYTVRSTPLSLLDKLSLYEASTDKELIKIREEILQLHLVYDISAVTENGDNDQHLATVKRSHDQHHFESTVEVDSIYGIYKVEPIGDLFDHGFKLTTGNKTVADVTKNTKLLKNTELCLVEINDDNGGDLFLLALVIVIWYAKRWRHM